MPVVSLGLDTQVGFTREQLVRTALWPSPAPVVVTQLLPILEGTLHDGVQTQLAETTASALGAGDLDVVGILPTAQVKLALRYGGLDALWACALGQEARRIGTTVMPQALGGVAYRHLYEVDAGLSTTQLWERQADGFIEMDGFDFTTRKVRRGTLSVHRTVSVWELLSCMVEQVTLAGTPQGVTCTVDLLPYSLSREPIRNTVATLAQAAPSTAPTVLFRDMVARMGPYSTSTPLVTTNEVGLAQWTLTLKNNLASGAGLRTGLFREEPERETVPTLTVGFDLARYSDDTAFTVWQTGAPFMLAFLFTGPQIQSTGQAYALNLYLPWAKLTQVAVPGPQQAPPKHAHAFVALVPPAPAAGFPGGSRQGPLMLETIGIESRHMLLAA